MHGHTACINSALIRFGVSFTACALASVTALADGIALSADGRRWVAGAGGYGDGWGGVGECLSVPIGSTIYIKYYSASKAGNSFSYAAHGSEWGGWRKTGPVLADGVGNGSANPVILRVDNIGTPKSITTWINGSGTWGGIPFPGAYDFGLDHQALWTLPPLVIRPGGPLPWWAAFWSPSRLGQTNQNLPEGESVPDSGGTAVLFGCALATAALLWRVLRRRVAGKHGTVPPVRR